MPYAPINGINLYYEVHGSGPALLFAHGQGGNHLSWWQQIPFFSRYYTCITYDQRAFGRSEDINNLGRTSFGADAIGLLNHLGVEKVRIVAHSMGSRSGTAVTFRATERCQALVLSGTSAGIGDEAIEEIRQAAAEARGNRGLGAFSVASEFKTQHPDKYHLLRAISRLNPSRPRDFLTRSFNPQRAQQFSVRDRLAEAGVPVLFVTGEHDEIAPAPMIERCHRLIPGSRFHVISGCGHSAYFEKPDEFNQVVFAFLQAIETADAEF